MDAEPYPGLWSRERLGMPNERDSQKHSRFKEKVGWGSHLQVFSVGEKVCVFLLASLGAQSVKDPPAMQETGV